VNEKLQRWALTAEIVGGLTVVVSLAIVAYELNQSTKEARLSTNALEISAYQSLIDSIIDLNNLIATDTDLAELRLKSSVSPEDISVVELLKINSFYINVIRHGDMAYFQYERGAIKKERLDSVLRIV